MRRTTRSTALALVVLTLAFAGCGTESDGAAAPPPSSAATEEDCTSTPPAELTAADDGRTFCLTVGGQLRLNLDGTKERPWSGVATTGDVLKPTNAGIVVLPGDAVAAYDAVAAGTTRLSAFRPLCAAPTGPSQVSCKGIQEWAVTVRVTE
ncbi:hypothetical protein [Streptomyces griseoruber]|uniref:Proteinase inhibitor I42 chagasin domain-containing protein n=1 Tax=Streptomyces griseoruber TaxID=1943 RepID=A0A117RC36_9ACTN|nr:hypothetical protein [Streptomyces griseoruber]KUN82636.1 hypothetical protein AQJ64_19125 [Streptomyces griseoruber]